MMKPDMSINRQEKGNKGFTQHFEIPRGLPRGRPRRMASCFAMKFNAPWQSAGFTLIEILFSVAIIALIGALSLVSFVNSRRVRDLTVAGQMTLSVLRTAQTNASAGKNASQWGVHLEQKKIVLFQGSAYVGAVASTSYPLSSDVEIVSVALAGGGQDAIFKRINGTTDQPGTFTVRVVDSPTQTFPVTLDASGGAYETGTASVSSGTRIVDARHRTFALGWSIQNSATLTLTFSDPPSADDPHDIAMSPSAPRSAFDWSGTFMVGGQNQTLRIHALDVSSSPTTLSVDRDCRKNTKKVKIAIDGKTIAAYEADCATVTVGAFGGVMSEP